MKLKLNELHRGGYKCKANSPVLIWDHVYIQCCKFSKTQYVYNTSRVSLLCLNLYEWWGFMGKFNPNTICFETEHCF